MTRQRPWSSNPKPAANSSRHQARPQFSDMLDLSGCGLKRVVLGIPGIPPTKDLPMRKLSSFSPCMRDLRLLTQHIIWHFLIFATTSTYGGTVSMTGQRHSDFGDPTLQCESLQVLRVHRNDSRSPAKKILVQPRHAHHRPQEPTEMFPSSVSLSRHARRDAWITLQGRHRMGISLRGCAMQLYRFPASQSSAGT